MDPKSIKNIVDNIKYPVVIKNNCKWPLLSWSLEDWSSHVQDKELCFRGRPRVITEEPCWERECPNRSLTFKEFISTEHGKNWLYFDYNYVDQWFSAESEISKQLKWDSFGFPDAGAKESSLWIGSVGAHTPCHQDSYGKNIVLQVYGRKRWLLFPPNAVNMKTTRIPYEESSMYSQLNFYYPGNLNAFQGLSGCRMVTLEPGDALVVPHKWWHYVEHVSPVGITINTWIPCEPDSESKVEESITRTIISQFCKDVPEECLLHLLNPNEDDVPEINLSMNLHQLETTVVDCMRKRSKTSQTKKRKTGDENQSCSDVSNSITNSHYVLDKDIEKVVNESSNIVVVNEITNDELMNILKDNLVKHSSNDSFEESDLPDENNLRSRDNTDNFRNHFACRLLKAICQPNVIQQIKENLIKDYET